MSAPGDPYLPAMHLLHPAACVPQELGKSNPQMLQMLNSHQSEFLELLEEEGQGELEDLFGMGGEEGEAGELAGACRPVCVLYVR